MLVYKGTPAVTLVCTWHPIGVQWQLNMWDMSLSANQYIKLDTFDAVAMET